MLIGLHPEEVLDMTYETLQICMKAYNDRRNVDYETQLGIAMSNAYYSGYYAIPSKRPKQNPDKVLKKMLRSGNINTKSEPDPELTYRRMEEKFKHGKS